VAVGDCLQQAGRNGRCTEQAHHEQQPTAEKDSRKELVFPSTEAVAEFAL
jgi:hypothetical protein